MELIDAFVDMANSIGEELNDGEDWPGWMTAQWADGVLEIMYEDTDNVQTTQRYRVTRIPS